MADRLTPDRRSWLMSRVRGRNTTPEIIVRRLLFKEGYRFRLHRKDLPGTPDLILPRHKVVVFVHGCFWHRHPNCSKATTPRTRKDFWTEKFDANRKRDARNVSALQEQGWRVLTIWECALKGKASLPFAELAEATIDWLRSEGEFGEIAGASESGREAS